jgi:PleD family two-component response regulator
LARAKAQAYLTTVTDPGVEQMRQGDLKRLRVLLVDDSHHIRVIVGTILRSVGIEAIAEASSGEQAIAMAKGTPFDVAFIDYLMEHGDGLELIRKLRDPKASPNPYMPIIMITGFSDRTRVLAARDAGVTEFIAKPVTAKAVLDRLSAALYKRRPFVESQSYFGPDRRRSSAEGDAGPRRRAGDKKPDPE